MIINNYVDFVAKTFLHKRICSSFICKQGLADTVEEISLRHSAFYDACFKIEDVSDLSSAYTVQFRQDGISDMEGGYTLANWDILQSDNFRFPVKAYLSMPSNFIVDSIHFWGAALNDYTRHCIDGNLVEALTNVDNIVLAISFHCFELNRVLIFGFQDKINEYMLTIEIDSNFDVAIHDWGLSFDELVISELFTIY